MYFSKQVDLKIIKNNLIMGNFGRKLYKEPNVANFYGFYTNKRNFTTLKWIIFLSGRETSGHMSLIAVSAFPKDKI